jgi:hypothetical protein
MYVETNKVKQRVCMDWVAPIEGKISICYDVQHNYYGLGDMGILPTPPPFFQKETRLLLASREDDPPLSQ